MTRAEIIERAAAIRDSAAQYAAQIPGQVPDDVMADAGDLSVPANLVAFVAEYPQWASFAVLYVLTQALDLCAAMIDSTLYLIPEAPPEEP